MTVIDSNSANPTRRRTFTLVELLVVMTIILILASLLLVGIKSVWGNTDRTNALTTVKRLYVAIGQYRLEKPYSWLADCGDYPAQDTDCHILLDPDGDPATTDGILDKIATYFSVDRDFMGASGMTMMDPWDQPYFYDICEDGVDGNTTIDASEGNETKDDANNVNLHWIGWGVTHPVKIFSCGENNVNGDFDGPEEWDTNLIIYQKE